MTLYNQPKTTPKSQQTTQQTNSYHTQTKTTNPTIPNTTKPNRSLQERQKHLKLDPTSPLPTSYRRQQPK